MVSRSTKCAEFASVYKAPCRQSAFTLAEVLITLGIIGVVAAMTLPTVTAKYRVSVVETSLKKFYTNMNQAVNLSVAQNGETKYWEFPTEDTPDNIEAFINKYIKQYIKIIDTQKDDKYYFMYFADGSGVRVSYLAKDWNYCLNAKDLSKINSSNILGNKCFYFGFYPQGACSVGSYSYKNFYNRGVEPYVVCLFEDEDGNISDTTVDDLYKNPALYTKIIQLNGWKVPKDYPIKF